MRNQIGHASEPARLNEAESRQLNPVSKTGMVSDAAFPFFSFTFIFNQSLRYELQQHHLYAQRAQSAAGPFSLPLWAVQETEKLADYVSRQLADLRAPTLVIHARDDEVCQLHTVQRVLAGTPSSRCSLTVLENSFHMVTLDHDRQQVASELCSVASRTHATADTGHSPLIPAPEAPSSRRTGRGHGGRESTNEQMGVAHEGC